MFFFEDRLHFCSLSFIFCSSLARFSLPPLGLSQTLSLSCLAIQTHQSMKICVCVRTTNTCFHISFRFGLHLICSLLLSFNVIYCIFCVYFQDSVASFHCHHFLFDELYAQKRQINSVQLSVRRDLV